MQIHTTSGLHGELIEYVADVDNGHIKAGVALVKRYGAPMEHRPYSTHNVFEVPGSVTGALAAENGHYDLTLSEARADLATRISRMTERA